MTATYLPTSIKWDENVFVGSLDGSEVDTIMKELSEIAFRIKDETGIATSIKEK